MAENEGEGKKGEDLLPSLCALFSQPWDSLAQGLVAQSSTGGLQAHGTCATFLLTLGEFSIHELSCTQLLHIEKLFIFHKGKLGDIEFFFQIHFFLPLENINVP